MENKFKLKINSGLALKGIMSRLPDMGNLDMDRASDEFPGVYCQGIQYYDLSCIRSMNNAEIANLVYLIRALSEKGIEVQFVNVCEKVKRKICELGLENILNCP